MRIGIDGGCLANRRGFGRFARELVAALARAKSEHEFVVFVDRPSLEQVAIPEPMATVAVDVRVAPSVAAAASGRRSVGDMLGMGRAVARGRLDAIFFPASYSFFPVWNAGRVVVTMHDTLALAHPEWVFPQGRGRLAWRIKETVAARMADRIVTVSEAARRDLAARTLRKYGVDPQVRFLLCVGGLSPHKNLPRLINAFGRAVTTGDDCRLVIVGDFTDVFHTEVRQIREQIARVGRPESVLMTGYVPDEDLAHFYRLSYALVQPSLMEGFGLPPVEAMASGTPVLASTAGSLPEVVGPAGLFFDPRDEREIEQVIRHFLADRSGREILGRVALQRAANFTWDRSAQLLLACFDQLAGS